MRPPTDTDQASPAWDVALLSRQRGQWSADDYIARTSRAGGRLAEYSAGRVEVLPMLMPAHQRTVFLLVRLLHASLSTGARGMVLTAPLRVQLWPGAYREPDVAVLLAEHPGREQAQYWEGADLAVEVVRPDDPERDRVTRRRAYARAGMAEYWTVDPLAGPVTVLVVEAGAYREHACAGRGEQAASHDTAGEPGCAGLRPACMRDACAPSHAHVGVCQQDLRTCCRGLPWRWMS